LSNNGRKNMQKKPVIDVMNRATAYRASSGLSSGSVVPLSHRYDR